MKEKYTSELEDGRAIYIPYWPASVAFENLTQVCKLLGQDEVIAISELNIPAAMVAVMSAEDPKEATQLVLHFVQQARVDGEKVVMGSMDDLGMSVIVELFAHVLKSQYSDFFESGLAKVRSQDK